jgi:septum formation protein
MPYTNSDLSLILASTSVYRKELLARLKLPFEIYAPGIDEFALENEPPSHTALRLARAKSEAAGSQYPASLIIGSDQVAVCEDMTLPKPMTHEKAVEQLCRISGRLVSFYTALALYNSMTGIVQAEVVETQVRFRTLSQADIERYLQAEPAYDCAGSAKAEGLGISLVESIDSSDPTALIGLPLIALSRMLRNQGVRIP